MKRRTQYSKEFKRDILDELEHKSVAQICREHGIHATLIHRWKREANKHGRDAFQGNGNTYKLEAELARYQRLVGRQAAEIDLLKKTQERLRQREAEQRRRRSE